MARVTGCSAARVLALAGAIAACVPLPHAAAQAPPGTISGLVTDDGGRPLADALVILDPASAARQVSTGADGRFRFTRVSRGRHDLRVLRIRYQPSERAVEVGEQGIELVIAMRPVSDVLDTLRVVARRTGVLGTVIDRVPFQPVAGASVTAMATRNATVSDSAGRFDLPMLREGGHVLMFRHPRFQPRVFSVIARADTAVELAITLDSLSAPGGTRHAMPLAEFEQRGRWMGALAALVPGRELAGRDGQSVGDALRYSLTFLRKGLLIDDAVTCVYVDGVPRPYSVVNDYAAGDVEAIEVYGQGADLTQTLARRWPRYTPCGNPNARQRYFGRNVARAVVIWLRG
ncbi:MAG TPA: carboxypeptidase regulatory-like domain-containing protein [Gemmatimonadaceae bacterium]|nr:carboxypeptidase regulatory-like domain-containing protein [Gemmatimonadaceae bacterium]